MSLRNPRLLYSIGSLTNSDKFDGKVTTRPHPHDNRMILVKVTSRKTQKAKDMMAAINDLFSEVQRGLHSHAIKVSLFLIKLGLEALY